jgi:hypothetical protein
VRILRAFFFSTVWVEKLELGSAMNTTDQGGETRERAGKKDEKQAVAVGDVVTEKIADHFTRLCK